MVGQYYDPLFVLDKNVTHAAEVGQQKDALVRERRIQFPRLLRDARQRWDHRQPPQHTRQDPHRGEH